MWKYRQSTGELFNAAGKLVSRGYSGKGRGKNNPALENMSGIGPLPHGLWKMIEHYDSHNVGPYAIKLDAVDVHPGNDRHDPSGRGAFRIHGDSIRAPGTASKGCLIFPRQVRVALWSSGDRLIEVVP
jgi:hypothetical protein